MKFPVCVNSFPQSCRAGSGREGAAAGREGGAGWAVPPGPHLALVDDGAIGLGLGAVAVGARAQAPGL